MLLHIIDIIYCKHLERHDEIQKRNCIMKNEHLWLLHCSFTDHQNFSQVLYLLRVWRSDEKNAPEWCNYCSTTEGKTLICGQSFSSMQTQHVSLLVNTDVSYKPTHLEKHEQKNPRVTCFELNCANVTKMWVQDFLFSVHDEDSSYCLLN